MNLEELKRKKLEELQSQQQEAYEMQQEMQKAESLAKTIMTKDALSRYGNISMAYPDKAAQVIGIILNLMQQGQIRQVDDNTLKEILRMIEPKRRDPKIRRISKG